MKAGHRATWILTDECVHFRANAGGKLLYLQNVAFFRDHLVQDGIDKKAEE